MTAESLRKQFKERLTELIISHNISNRKLSTEIGMSSSYIQGVISGGHLPSLDTFFTICEYFDITPYEFFVPRESKAADYVKLYHMINNCSPEKISFLIATLENLDDILGGTGGNPQ